MFIWFLTVYLSFTFYCCFCQALPTPKQDKLSCKIKNSIETYSKVIPGVIPITILRNQTVTVIVDVADKPVFFRACELSMPIGVPSKDCQELIMAYGNKVYPSHNITTTGQQLISLNLPDHLLSNPYVLQLSFSKDYKNYAERYNGVANNDTLTVCGVFAVGNLRTKRQAESCQGAGEYTVLPGIDEWCRVNCAVGYCPSTHCTCANQAWPALEEEDYENEGDLQVEFL